MPAVTSTKYLVQAGWDHVPHLSESAKAELLAGTLPHLREARSEGKPSIGSGAIYPYDIERLLIDPFPIPNFYRRAYGLDVGWNRTAALWGALDADTDVLYLHAEHYLGREQPATHAAAIKARGEWIPGVIDPASRGRSQKDGEQLIKEYRTAGLKVTPANNAVEAGLEAVWMRMTTGRLRIFRSCLNLIDEMKLYRRDENGHIVKKRDHLMDAMRYLVLSGLKVARVRYMALPGSSTTGIADKRAGY